MQRFMRAVPWGGLRAAAMVFLFLGTLTVLALAVGIGIGRVQVSMVSNGEPTALSAFDTRAVSVLMGVLGVALGLLLTAWILLARPLRGAMLASKALTSAAAQGYEPEHLAMDEKFGPIARSWNELLRRMEELRRGDTIARASRVERRGSPHAGDELRRVCEAMWQGMVVLNADGTVRYANGAAATLLGTEPEKMVGAEFTTLLPAEAGEQVRRAVRGARTAAKVEVTIGDPESGQSFLRFTSRPVRRDDGGHIMLVIEDVTQQRAADTAWKTLVAQVSHELRTPLTNIQLYVEELQDDQTGDPEVRARALNVINQEAHRLERVIADMLSMSEIESGKISLRLGDVRLESLFDELRLDYQASAEEKHLTLRFDLPPKLPQVSADRDKLAMVLHNLLSNAVKYTPEGGEVVVRVEESGSNLLIEVSDTGIGISEEELDRVFEKFYRSKDERVGQITGTGLGLSIAREVARQHGGDIRVNSKLNEGSTFTLMLPIQRMAA